MSVDDDKAKAARVAERSGNNFHCKVLRHLKSQGWEILVSPYYIDSISNKPREIDLIAEKSFFYEGRFVSGQKEFRANIRLFIECKYTKQTTIFWFADKDVTRARELVVRDMNGREGNRLTDYHHYISGGQRVAKLFNSESADGSENDPVFRALNQCMNGRINSDREYGCLTGEAPEYEFIFPVIVWSGFESFYSKNIEDDNAPEPLVGNFMMEVNYAWVDPYSKNNRSQYLLIDMVDFNKIDQYLGLLVTNLEKYKDILYPEAELMPGYED